MKKFSPLAIWLLVVAFLMLVTVPVLAGPTGCVFLVQLPRKFYTNCMWSREHSRMGGVDVSTNVMGTGGESDSTMQYELKGNYDMFESLIGYLDSAPDNRQATFELWGDGQVLQKIGPLSSNDAPCTMRVMVKGVQMIQLRIVPQSYNATASAAWGDPKLWIGVTDEAVTGSVIVSTTDRSYQAMPNTIGNRKEIQMPIPLMPGKHEFRVITEYDPSAGKVQITTHEVTPSVVQE